MSFIRQNRNTMTFINKEQVYPDLPRNDLQGNSSRAWKSRGSRGSGTLRHIACRVGRWMLLRLGSAWYMLFFKDYKYIDIVYNNLLKIWSCTLLQVFIFLVMFFQKFKRYRQSLYCSLFLKILISHTGACFVFLEV